MNFAQLRNSVNLLFLVSLAVIAWVILVYFQYLEERRMESFKENYLVNMEIANVPCKSDHLEVFFNFLCIFGCLFILAKLIQYLDQCFSSRLNNEPNNNTVRQTEVREGIPVEQNFQVQISNLEVENSKLVADLNQKNHILTALLDMRQNRGDEPLDLTKDAIIGSVAAAKKKALSNIYISNRHIHFNRQIYVNDGDYNIGLNGLNRRYKPEQQTNWGKYLQASHHISMRAFGEFERPHFNDASSVPIVTTADLHQMHGLVTL
ncbi:uncharacterized protein LOC119668767 [Teleopsis dalmanni]|uniref:uncharacterized protein LOC119668767 n=1 Tax=Teleopsis dalmanni TaxID=139649 RepID=UPI0018CE7644|nr:uncharacterized protein LOC119668767 [Teleopsis dalmanni]